MIIEQDLKDAGYRRFEQNQGDHQYSDFFYQHKIQDAKGTKYVVNFWHYQPMDLDYPDGTWMFEIVLNEPHSTFQMHRVEDIQQCEAKGAEFWRLMGSVYYELNHEN